MHLTPVTEKYVDVDGLKVHYTAQGSGPTVIFVHGWCCDASSWRCQVPVFSRDYRVITIDLPGHGKSALLSRDLSMSLFAKAIEAVRDEVGADLIVLVGHSMGVIVIREYALTHSKHLAGMVAVDGPLDVRKFASRASGQAPMTLFAREVLIERMFGPQTPEALRIEITTMMLRTSDSAAAGAGAAMFNFETNACREIKVPALTIYAGAPLFGLNSLTKEAFPKWEAAQIPGTGHFVMMEKPDEFNYLLAGFLNSRSDFS